MRKILFLDIDNVLNRGLQFANGYSGIEPIRVEILNNIVRETGAEIVLASAWRYMILGGSLTLDGFRYILAIHGASQQTQTALIDYLPKDIPQNDSGRGILAKAWLDQQTGVHIAAALDDGINGGDWGYSANGIRCFAPLPQAGLTAPLALEVIQYLNSKGKL